MNVQRFSNGGYVAHKLQINSTISPMRFSAWFSGAGELLDVEAFDKAGRSRPASPKARKVISSMFGIVAATYRAQTRS